MAIAKHSGVSSGLIIFMATCAVLYVAQEVLIPIVLATLLSLVLVPMVNFLQRRGMGNVLACLTVMSLVTVLIAGILWLLAAQLSVVAGDFPKYQANLKARLAAISASQVISIAGSVSRLNDAAAKPSGEPTEHPPETVVRTSPRPEPAVAAAAPPTDHQFKVADMIGVLSSALHPLAVGGMVVLLSIFMLINRADLHDRFLIVSGRVAGRGRLPLSWQAIDEAIGTISTYLYLQSASNACMAVAVFGGLLVLGVPHPLLWATLSFFLRFIPYIGMLIAGGMTILFSLAIADGLTTPLLITGMFTVLELLLASVLEPLFFGHRTGLSTLAILVSAAFWTWLWGTTGLFLSIPLTVCWVLIGRNFKNFDFLDTLLSNRARLPPEKLLYHRLLVMDSSEFASALEYHTQSLGIDEIYDRVLIPTLCLADAEFQSDRISPERFDFIVINLRLLIEELADRFSDQVAVPTSAVAPAVTTAESPARRILCVPSLGEMDELASGIVSHLLVARGADAHTLGAGTPAEVLQALANPSVSAVCLCALSDQGALRAIAWSRIIRGRFPDLTIVIAALNPTHKTHARIEKATERYRLQLAYTLQDAIARLWPEPEYEAKAV